MYLDYQNQFSDAQAITVDAASTNIIDLGAPGAVFSGRTQTRDIGPGTLIEVAMNVDVSFVTMVSMIISLQTDSSAGFGSAVTVWSTGSILTATLVAGYAIPLPVAVGLQGIKRYLRLFYDVTTTATAGAITAGLVLDRQANPTG